MTFHEALTYARRGRFFAFWTDSVDLCALEQVEAIKMGLA